MALIVETGGALENAESYASVADADSYARLRNNNGGWINDPASIELVLGAQPVDGETLTIGSKTYTFEAALTDVDGNVAIGGDLATTQANFAAAIDLGPGSGTAYAASMTKNTDVRADSGGFDSDDRLELRARASGTAGNSIAVSETFDAEENFFDGTTLAGGTAHISNKAKEDALRRATEYLDRTYTGQWRGFRFTEEQALDWPRDGAHDNDHYLLDSDAIPEDLKRACFEAAILLISGEDLDPNQTTPGAIKREKVKAGPVESDTEYTNAGAAQQPKWQRVRHYVRNLIESSAFFERA